MKFTLLENVYDDGGNERARRFFQKVGKWIKESLNKDNWKKILERDYSQYLVGSGIIESGTISQMRDLYENCEGCNGECKTCYVKNESVGESGMNDIDNMVQGAFGPREKREEDEPLSCGIVHRFTETGIRQTEHSILDERAFDEAVKVERERNKPKKNLTEAEIDEEIQEALGKREYDQGKYL